MGSRTSRLPQATVTLASRSSCGAAKRNPDTLGNASEMPARRCPPARGQDLLRRNPETGCRTRRRRCPASPAPPAPGRRGGRSNSRPIRSPPPRIAWPQSCSAREVKPTGEKAVAERTAPARASSRAIAPPIELPTRWGARPLSRRRSPAAARRSPRRSGSVPSRALAPKPGRSKAITSRSPASRSITGAKAAPRLPIPYQDKRFALSGALVVIPSPPAQPDRPAARASAATAARRAGPTSASTPPLAVEGSHVGVEIDLDRVALDAT